MPNDYKICQMTTKYAKWPQNMPTDHKICQMTTKYAKWLQSIPNCRKIFQHFPFRGPPKFSQVDIFGTKMCTASGNPADPCWLAAIESIARTNDFRCRTVVRNPANREYSVHSAVGRSYKGFRFTYVHNPTDCVVGHNFHRCRTAKIESYFCRTTSESVVRHNFHRQEQSYFLSHNIWKCRTTQFSQLGSILSFAVQHLKVLYNTILADRINPIFCCSTS
jgi:hypothetical protein